MISYREAQEIILAETRSFGTEIIGLDDADGRILAEDIFADRDYPPFNRSAMDGYAVMIDDWEKGIREFQVQQIIYAGTTPDAALRPGSAFKIMTGAAVPYPADTVIRKEDTLESGGKISFTVNSLKRHRNIAQQGEDLKKGALALSRHTQCSPTVISTLATLGKSQIQVEALPKVSLFTTGNEVKDIHTPLSDVEIRNSNYYLLKSLLKSRGITAEYQHLPDDKTELRSHLKKALSSDIIILSGGVSAGDADYVPEVLDDIGVKKLFHKVAIKPGKPFWCGKTNNGTMVFALPGNPFSSFVTFKIFVEPFLLKSSGVTPSGCLRGLLTGVKLKKTSFDEFFPVRITENGVKIQATNLNGSGDIRLGTDADALAIHPSEMEILSDGCQVEYYKI